jgi:hypothetical protein
LRQNAIDRGIQQCDDCDIDAANGDEQQKRDCYVLDGPPTVAWRKKKIPSRHRRQNHGQNARPKSADQCHRNNRRIVSDEGNSLHHIPGDKPAHKDCNGNQAHGNAVSRHRVLPNGMQTVYETVRPEGRR